MADERWYEFEQHELLVRAFFVRAHSLAEARAKVRADPAGTEGVPDVAGSGPDYIKIKGRGRLAEQGLAQARADELESGESEPDQRKGPA